MRRVELAADEEANGDPSPVDDVDFEVAGEAGDERQAEADPGAVGARAHADAAVAYLELKTFTGDDGADAKRPWCGPVSIRVNDDVGKQFGHDQGHRVDVHVDTVAFDVPTNSMACLRDVVRDSRQRELERSYLARHGAASGRRNHADEPGKTVIALVVVVAVDDDAALPVTEEGRGVTNLRSGGGRIATGPRSPRRKHRLPLPELDPGGWVKDALQPPPTRDAAAPSARLGRGRRRDPRRGILSLRRALVRGRSL